MRSENFFERGLHACGNAAMALLEWPPLFARGPQPLFQVSREKPAQHRCAIRLSPTHVRALGLMREIFQTQAKRKRPIGIYYLAKFIGKFRFTVSRQAHHLVFVAKLPEADVLRQRGVIHSQRMREPDFSEGAHVRSFAQGPHATGKVTQAISGEYRGILERRDEIGARKGW